MFGTVLITAYTVMLAYVLWRIRSVPWFEKQFSRTGAVWIGAIFWLVFLLARTMANRQTSVLAGIVEYTGMAMLGTVFLMATAFFLVDLGTLFGLILTRWRRPLMSGAMTAGVVMAGMAMVQGLRSPAVVYYEATLPGLPAELDGSVLVAVSDTHLGTMLGNRWLSGRVMQIQALKPDLLVFLGDIFEGHGKAPRDLPALRRLSVPMGKWFVDGNHESHHKGGTGLKTMTHAGFRRLDNQWAQVAPGLILSGVNDLTNHKRRNPNGDPLAAALSHRPVGATVLLSHAPWQVDRAARAGVALMLSGHTHGGQIWPFGYLVQTVYPFFAGRYRVDGMTLLVGRGTGTWGPRMRLWHRGEILKIRLNAPLSFPGPGKG